MLHGATIASLQVTQLIHELLFGIFYAFIVVFQDQLLPFALFDKVYFRSCNFKI